MDGQTDRQTERPSQYRALHYMQSHGNNHWPQESTWTMTSDDDGVYLYKTEPQTQLLVSCIQGTL